ncbi:PhzF family phenazine biosynthesis protein [Microbulbifer variabilis]|uniref:PhzF family phenazine biosynthesis protein n=1 Tax=Microbulbifer variabilis TaxID=266805 RepID=UPI00036B9744|nr:PhzF family phenazine biosynthesis protein [Microbulbifer variabilis]
MHRYTVVNAFGREPFTGNPVAVFFDCDDLDSNSMQRIAAELNLSETTFIGTPSKGGDVNVRIFTPVNELDFAGHPLLGTALALSKATDLTELKIETKKGLFNFAVQSVKENSFSAYIQMEQPCPVISSFDYQEALLEALGVRRSTLPVDMYDVGPRHVFVGVDNKDELAQISPDLRRLSDFHNMAALCFSPDIGDSWRLRMFSPAYGVAEDAATGSAAGPLALHLSRYGLVKFGAEIKITQGVEMGRPSRMNAMANIKNDSPFLKVGGYGFQVATGQYFI